MLEILGLITYMYTHSHNYDFRIKNLPNALTLFYTVSILSSGLKKKVFKAAAIINAECTCNNLNDKY